MRTLDHPPTNERSHTNETTTTTDVKKPEGVVETSAIATATTTSEHPQPSAPTAAELIPAKTE